MSAKQPAAPRFGHGLDEAADFARGARGTWSSAMIIGNFFSLSFDQSM
jgi:hypothetical protein